MIGKEREKVIYRKRFPKGFSTETGNLTEKVV